VLYVEDSFDQRIALKTQMLEWGMQVDAFPSADEAWEALQTIHYDLVICDVVLSGHMSGSRFINRIRRQPGPAGRMLILAASAFDDPARRIELFHLGIDDYIAKPIVPLELKARIQNLLARKQALEQNRQLLEATQLGVTVIDARGRIRSSDANALAMFGQTEKAVLGMPISLLIGDDAEEGNASRPIAPLRDKCYEFSRSRKTGLRHGTEPFPIEITALNLADAGPDRQIALLTRDISEELQLAEYLTKAKESAERAGRMKSEFLANMSHEIRTPLNAIVGMAHVMRRAGVSPEQSGHLDKIDAAGHHLLNVINSVLDLSKIEAGKFVLEETRVSIGAIPVNVASILTPSAQAKHLKLTVEAEPLAHHVLGDPVRLQQALLNYASNAIKFTESGHIILRVKPEREWNDAILVRFEVQDSGIGIPPALAERLFAAFEQADSSTSRKHGGTGLGLVITKKLAQMMGGDAGVLSAPDGGSLFWFTARLKKGESESSATENTSDQAPEHELRGKYRNRLILVVEDEPINREIAQALLEDVGQKVDLAEDGIQAVEMASHNAYDLILMDMQMPVMGGIEATRLIRQLPQCADVPILAITANAFNEDKTRCLEAGMNDFIAKPVDPSVLFTTLLKWLSSKEQ
jgi:PAS domain S-box-containing protein